MRSFMQVALSVAFTLRKVHGSEWTSWLLYHIIKILTKQLGSTGSQGRVSKDVVNAWQKGYYTKSKAKPPTLLNLEYGAHESLTRVCRNKRYRDRMKQCQCIVRRRVVRTENYRKINSNNIYIYIYKKRQSFLDGRRLELS